MSNITVILGAGASAGLIPPESQTSIRDPRYPPPLVKDLFLTHGELEPNYSSFPGVEKNLGELRLVCANTAKSLEEFLKSLKEAKEEYRRQQFRHFAPYLQNFFHLVSHNYCRSPVNYNTLLNKTLQEKFSKVAYVTLNYDLLFDRALEGHHGTNFQIRNGDIKKYVPEGKKWLYVKLHGSVDWGRRIDKHFIQNPGRTTASLLDNVDQLGDKISEALEDEIVIDQSYFNSERELVYPAISVPVDGESKFNCPPLLVDKLKEHFNQCHNFLIIGFSGIDTDLLQLLNEKEGGFGKVMIVDRSEEAANHVRANLMSFPELGEKLQMSVEVYKGEGFSQFLKDGSIDDFLAKTL